MVNITPSHFLCNGIPSFPLIPKATSMNPESTPIYSSPARSKQKHEVHQKLFPKMEIFFPALGFPPPPKGHSPHFSFRSRHNMLLLHYQERQNQSELPEASFAVKKSRNVLRKSQTYEGISVADPFPTHVQPETFLLPFKVLSKNVFHFFSLLPQCCSQSQGIASWTDCNICQN